MMVYLKTAVRLRNFLIVVLAVFEFSASCRAWIYDPSKPLIYEMRIAFETDKWINMYSTATVLSKSDNTVAFRVVANSTTTGAAYQLVVTTQGNVGIGLETPSAKLHVNDSADSSQAYIRAANFEPVPYTQWPTFDSATPYLLRYALWVGWDDTAKAWKYYRDTANTRGLTDPGDPSGWTVNGTAIGYFHGNLGDVPPGTHINNKYNPNLPAYRCRKSGGASCDDIQVKVGDFWADKYAARVIDVGSGYNGSTLKDDNFADLGGQDFSPYWLALSQKAQGSTNMTWFEAQQACINAGKTILSNAQWQAAAAGTAQSAGNGVSGGRDWSSGAPDAELSRHGLAGMAGNLWDWVADWGTAGAGTSQSYGGTVVWDGSASGYNDDYMWNVGGYAYTNYNSMGWTQGLVPALLRGGYWDDGAIAGVFAFIANHAPSFWGGNVGFRCGRSR